MLQQGWAEVVPCRQKNVIGMVAKYDSEVVGFSVYALEKKKVVLLDFAVAPLHQRQGIGTTMLFKEAPNNCGLARKLHPHRRHSIEVDVWDRLDGAHFFLRAIGFKAIRVLREDGGDYYRFRYRVNESVPAPV